MLRCVDDKCKTHEWGLGTLLNKLGIHATLRANFATFRVYIFVSHTMHKLGPRNDISYCFRLHVEYDDGLNWISREIGAFELN